MKTALAPPEYRVGGFLQALNGKILARRVPVSGSIDLTHRCNLRCRHCYLKGDGGGGAGNARPPGRERWISLIGEIAEAGCLNLLISGGEPLLSPHFGAVYRESRERGMLVTVFSNGTLVDDAVIDLFRDLPPQFVEISLYGATPAVYEAVTGVRGSYRACLEGIGRLQEAGVAVRLKTVVLQLNRDEVPGMEEMARGRGLPFRLDAALFPCTDGDRSPLAMRIPPAEAVAMEFADPQRAAAWKRHYERSEGAAGQDVLYTCAAGQTHFHVDPAGRLSPCVMLSEPGFDLHTGSFKEGWEGPVREIRDLQAPEGYRCNSCGKRFLCGLCPAFFERETGSPRIPSDYLCALGEERLRAVKSVSPGEGNSI